MDVVELLRCSADLIEAEDLDRDTKIRSEVEELRSLADLILKDVADEADVVIGILEGERDPAIRRICEAVEREGALPEAPVVEIKDGRIT